MLVVDRSSSRFFKVFKVSFLKHSTNIKQYNFNYFSEIRSLDLLIFFVCSMFAYYACICNRSIVSPVLFTMISHLHFTPSTPVMFRLVHLSTTISSYNFFTFLRYFFTSICPPQLRYLKFLHDHLSYTIFTTVLCLNTEHYQIHNLESTKHSDSIACFSRHLKF